jgi:hypothetical protein
MRDWQFASAEMPPAGVSRRVASSSSFLQAISVTDVDPVIACPNNTGVVVAPTSKTCRDRKAPVAAKASDADASAAEAVKSSSAETATKRGSAETNDPTPETANRTTPEATTPRPTATEAAAAKPATMPSGEPTTMPSGEPATTMTPAEPTTVTATPTVTAAPAATVTTATAAAMATPTATPTREGINRGKSNCSTDDGGDSNSDDCFFKHGKSPLEQPPRQNQP